MKKTLFALAAVGIVAAGMGTAWAAISRTAAIKPVQIVTPPATAPRQPASGS